MRILLINVMCGIRSTGRICVDIANELEKQGHKVVIAYGRGPVPENYRKYAHQIGSELDVMVHGIKARFLDRGGFGSTNKTKHFVKWIEQFDPDVIHIHNLHGYYIDIRVLFTYLKKCGKKIIWTLHDCWPFTGHCCYFDFASCEKWKTGCNHCPNKKEYPASILIDSSKRNYTEKRKLFTDVPNMILVTPSKWLADLTEKSFMNKYPIAVIHNGINTKVFKHTESNIKERLNIYNKKIILGVAAVWHRRKGLDDFIKLAKVIASDYQIVLIGLTEKQIRELPSNIIGIRRTNSTRELAEFYSMAYVYINPTYEDNYPTTNLEAIACGTPVITYMTGGSGESASIYGKIVDKGDLKGIISAIEGIDNCQRSTEEIDALSSVTKYISMYME